MAIMFVVGEAWVRRQGRAPEFYDSAVITAWVWFSFFRATQSLILSFDRGLVMLSRLNIILSFTGCNPVNTFTEHWGGAWSVKDMQHTYIKFSYCAGVLHTNLPIQCHGWHPL
jgi:hypothetical protein